MKLSIAMATRNGEPYLQQQLDSIAAQSLRPDELVVSDDASTDRTRDLIQAFAARTRFPVRLLVNDEPLGVPGNFTRAIGHCRGDVIVLADQDDRWRPDKLQTLHQAFADAPGPLLAFSDLALIDSDGRPTGRTQWRQLGFTTRRRKVFQRRPTQVLLRYNVVTGAAMAFSASLRELLLPIPDEWTHDEWIALLAAAVGAIAMIEQPLVEYRQHAGQQIGGAVSGLRAQVRYAKQNMNESYMRRMALRSRQAAERLERHRSIVRDQNIIDALNERAEHYERRGSMHGIGRLRVVMHEWSSGCYGRFGYGWKSALQDLLLR